ncbi:hypothetical protein [Aequorivita echinoideorum]|uniref:DUF1643 domain-containing protein n=1 Tax=Aequorivita echinoideorum TaxID=1549647 RepID=A0ABS5S7P9_9FLAO|nr:hypothetical protein [Aequorivita echinoideorum]MBT0609233.1 hypothetical protein [Aequorivita echinoideorum]
MRENFDVTGYFYKINKLKCRKYLNIKRKGFQIQMPDLMVVMMNPGKSKPVNGIDDGKKEVETIPDRTQDQIMRVMENCGFQYSRILNLSDIRITPSGAFYNLLPTLEKEQIPHSIFSSHREKDFRELFVKNIPTIFAWGVDKNLTELAKIATDNIGIENPIGLRKIGQEYAFYHPLPRNNNDQIKWVARITERIKTA